MATLLLNPKSKYVFLLLLLLIPVVSFSQTTIWLEDFSAYNDNTTVGTGNKWTATTVSGSRDFDVTSNQYRGYNLDSEQVFTTESIDISSYTNVSLSVDVSEGVNQEGSDYINVYYQLDTGSGFGAEIAFATNGTNSGNFTSATATQTGLNGVAVRIVIRVLNNANNEYHYFDNLLVQGTLNAGVYCPASGNTAYNTGVTLVSFNTINNADTDNTNTGYEDFTGTSTDVIQNTAYDLTVNIQTDGNYVVQTIVWIDWNQDFDFDDAGETYDLGSDTNVDDAATASSPYSITIPATASLGNTRMRVAVKFGNNDPTPCEISYDGEVEDYTLNVIAPPSGPEINITGNGNNIPNGNTAISITDDTDFGSVNVSSGTVTHTFTIQNIGTTDLTISSVSISGDSEFTISGISTPLIVTSGSSTTFNVDFDPNTTGSFSATVSINNDDSDENPYTFDVAGQGVDLCTTTISALPYVEDFESGVPASWVQDSTDNFDWTWQSGSTPSSNTGPDGAHSGSYYLFTEASSNFNNTANIESPCFDLSGTTNPRITFFVHFYGADMGTLNVQVSTDGGSTYPDTVYSHTAGEVQNDYDSSWTPISIQLNSYIGQTIKFRFQGITGSNYASDISLDYISVTDRANPTFGPGGIFNDLSIWLKANDGLSYSDGQSVSLWEDQGLASNARVLNSGQEPTFYDNSTRNINFNPVVEFDNPYSTYTEDTDFSHDRTTSSQFLAGDYGLYTQEMFIVLITDDTPITSSFGFMDVYCGDAHLDVNANDATGIGFGFYTGRVSGEIICYAHDTYTESESGDGYAVAEIGTGSSYNNVGIINARNNSADTQQELFYNANDIGNTQNDIAEYMNTNDTRYFIGRSEGWEASLNARVAEVISYSVRKNDADLTDERNRIQSYLAVKYGITLGVNGTSQDYVDSQGNVIWDQSNNTGFNYDIAGIGRDDASELNQKQSKSVNDANDITIGLTNIYNTNNENITTNSANTFTDRNFLMWGNNNASLNQGTVVNVDMSAGPEVTVTGGTNVNFTPIERIWKVVEVGSIGTVEVAVPETMLSATLSPPGDYLMFISNTPSFDPTSEYRVMTLNGSNLEATYDFDGTKYITFGYAPERTFVRSIWFDGAVDYLDAGNVLDLNSSFTISAWIKTEDGNSTIVSKRDDGNTTGYDLGLDNSRNVVMSWNGGAETITSSVAIPLNEWHHIAVTYNGTTARLYIDGVEDTTANLSPPTSNSESFLIAAADGDEADTTSFFQGNIDEVRIWDVALTAEQLRFVMNQEIEDNTQVAGTFFNTTLGVTPTKNDIAAIPWSNLQGYYPMSTYTFTNCKDLSNNGYTAALRNLNTVDNQTAPLPYVSTADGDWDTASTWANGSVQTIPGSASLVDSNTTVDWNIVQISSNVTMDNSSLPAGNNGNRSVLGLIVDNTYELEVQGTIDVTDGEGTGNGLTVSHYVGLDGKIDLEGESQLIQTTDSDLSAGANGILERDQQGNGNVYRYNDWSSPVQQIYNGSTYSRPNNNTFNISGVLFDGTNSAAPLAINFVGGYNGSNGTPISIADYWLYVYTNFAHDTYSAWLHAGNATILDVGEGFLMKGTNIADYQNYVFQGTPNNGDIQLTVSADNDYLVGNPYPSAIDANKFIDDNAASIEGALYFWDHFGGDSHNLADYAAGFATYNKTMPVVAPNHPNHTNTSGSGTKLPGRYIAVGQAFFVQGKGAGDKVIEFNNSQRTFIPEDSGASSIFMKPSKSKKQTESYKNINTITDTRKKIRLGFINTDGGHRQIGLGFDENTTEGYDYGYDALLYDYLKDEMYWLINNKKYVIQALPNFSEDLEIPLGIEVKDGGKVAIQLDGLENFEDDQKVFIKDLTTEEVFEITSNSFEIELDAGEYHDRFALVFQPRYFSLSEVELEEGFLIYMNNKESELEIQRIVDTEVLNIQLFNYLGQTMASWTTNLNERITRKPIYNMATGVYIVQINTKDGATNKKIFIK